MTVRPMGVEEELLVVDPATGEVEGQADAVVAASADGPAPVDVEILAEQVETGTDPCRTAEDLRAELHRRRRRAVEAARSVGLEVAALATPPLPSTPHVSDDERYRRIRTLYGPLVPEQLCCGCHVHVEVASPEEGVAVLDRIGPWLPVLRALTTNSPFWWGEDTGYASYRTVVWGRWPSAGPSGPFGSAAGYDGTVADMVATGALVDERMVYFDARLSRPLSTVELRVADVCLDPEDALLYAVLARALVETAAREAAAGVPPPGMRPEVLALAHWRAARSGLGGELVDPRDGRPAPAHTVVGVLGDHVADALAEAGDDELVRDARARLRGRGTGADVQRALAARHGGDLPSLVREAVRRTDPGA